MEQGGHERPNEMVKKEIAFPKHLYEALKFLADDNGDTPDGLLMKLLREHVDKCAKNYKSHGLPGAAQLEPGDVVGSLEAYVGSVVMGPDGYMQLDMEQHPVSPMNHGMLQRIINNMRKGMDLVHPLGHTVKVENPITQEMLLALQDAISDATVHNIHMTSIPAFLHEMRKQRK